MPSPIRTLHAFLEEHDLWHQTLELKRGDHLHFTGDRDDRVYYIEMGTVYSYVVIDGEEQIIRFGYAGDFFAAVDCLITQQPTILNARVLRKCTVKVLQRSAYEEYVLTNPLLSGVWQQILSWMVVGQLEREIDLLTNDPAERYRRVLARSPRLFQEVPAKYIANYLRMTAETLSRVRRVIGE